MSTSSATMWAIWNHGQNGYVAVGNHYSYDPDLQNAVIFKKLKTAKDAKERHEKAYGPCEIRVVTLQVSGTAQ